MRRWQVFVVLAAVVLVLLLLLELLPDDLDRLDRGSEKVVLATLTATVTPTPGWWEQVTPWSASATKTPALTPTPQQGERP